MIVAKAHIITVVMILASFIPMTVYSAFPLRHYVKSQVASGKGMDPVRPHPYTDHSGGETGFGIASLACGVASVFFLRLTFGTDNLGTAVIAVLGMILTTVAAIVLGAIGLNKRFSWLAIAGVSLGVLMFLVLLLLVAGRA